MEIDRLIKFYTSYSPIVDQSLNLETLTSTLTLTNGDRSTKIPIVNFIAKTCTEDQFTELVLSFGSTLGLYPTLSLQSFLTRTQIDPLTVELDQLYKIGSLF